MYAIRGRPCGSGAPERAARLYAAAEAIREQIGSPVLPIDRPAYELALASMHTRLDPRRFADLWAEGRALTSDAAVAYAISEKGGS